MAKSLFLFAYTCSGVAGLIYQVCWTRLLALYIGHSTAAASAVVAAFLGGLAVGAGAGGWAAARLQPRGALLGYAAVELLVALLALLLPLELHALTPLLAASYKDGAPSLLFPMIRVLVCVILVFVPAAALGASFPLAVRWFSANQRNRARAGGLLYALNSAGAALGAIAAGFLLIPVLGVSGTTHVAVGASVIAAVAVAIIASQRVQGVPRVQEVQGVQLARPHVSAETRWFAAIVLGVSGFAALVHEIAWTRVLTMVFGPTIYAFSAALAAVIVGIALGSSVGTALVARSREPAKWLALTLALASVASTLTAALAGGPITQTVAEQVAAAPNLFNELLLRGALVSTALVVPVSAMLGAAFPLALALVDDPAKSAAGEFGFVYAMNTVGSVLGSLVAGFAIIPMLGLEHTLRLVTVCLAFGAVVVLSVAGFGRAGARVGWATSAVAVVVMVISPPWDRELLASGAYLYAPFAPRGVELEPLLKAGTLLYYREGAAATVSVKRLTGTTTLAVDGKTDASNRGDMLTQKLVGHLPLLLHDNPRDVAVIGLGSGVTVGAVLRHPVGRVDVAEISPEVVEASQWFATENRNALADPRINLLVADGRSHLQLSERKYDVIISEPSNPWIAGVAALFTREFFEAARNRLQPGGFICQWANAYNISDRDLRSIVATFLEVFPHGTAWLVGADDVVLLASDVPIDDRLPRIERHWARSGVAEDLATVVATEPFALWSLFVGGPRELQTYAADADVLTDDRMTLEFSGPRELRTGGVGDNGAKLRALLAGDDSGPALIRRARRTASAEQWRRRGDMMAARDAYTTAYEDYLQALRLDAHDGDALAGLVRTAILTRRGGEAVAALQSFASNKEGTAEFLVARSKLLASTGARAEAVAVAREAADRNSASGLEQLASLYADAGDTAQLHATLTRMRTLMPDHPARAYYEAVAAFLAGNAEHALKWAQQCVVHDRRYAAAYDLMGAAHAKLGQRDRARDAFRISLQFDAHDSTAYANLGVLALEEGRRDEAVDLFAEALWLDSESALAREGLARALALGS